jgi:hypothetical protein
MRSSWRRDSLSGNRRYENAKQAGCGKPEQAQTVRLHGVIMPLPSATVKIWSIEGTRISSFAPLGQSIST